MKESPEGTFRFNAFDNIDLYELTETAQNEDYEKISSWVAQYKLKQLQEKNKEYEWHQKRSYNGDFHVLISLIDTYLQRKKAIPTPGEIWRENNLFLILPEIYQGLLSWPELRHIRKRIITLTREILENTPCDDQLKEEVLEYLSLDRINQGFKEALIRTFIGENTLKEMEREEALSQVTEDKALEVFMHKMFDSHHHQQKTSYTDPDQFLAKYQDKLKNHVFLIEELVEILEEEYEKRIIDTQKRFNEFLLPRKRLMEKIQKDLTEIDEDLAFLQEDQHIDQEDKEKISIAFQRKRQEFEDMQRREGEKLKSVHLLSKGIRRSVQDFQDLIKHLKEKLRYVKKREFYVDKLARYGAHIPQMENVLNLLYETFQQDMEDLQRGFLLFDSNFQRSLMGAIEDQGMINKIILAPPSTVEAELALEDDTPLVQRGDSAPQRDLMGEIEEDFNNLPRLDREK